MFFSFISISLNDVIAPTSRKFLEASPSQKYIPAESVNDFETTKTRLDQRLVQAAEDDNVETMKTLLQQGASPDQRNGKKVPALHFTAIYGNRGAAQLLLNAGADVHAKDGDGKTAVDWAYDLEHPEFATWLKEKIDEENLN